MEISNLIHRHVYHLNARNLVVGVWDELRVSFVGIRYKWGELFLDTVYPGTTLDTALPIEDLGPIPEDLVVTGCLGSYDSNTNRSVYFTPELDSEHWTEPKWFYKDDCTVVEDCSAIYAEPNKALLAYLEPIDERLRTARSQCDWTKAPRI